MTAYMTFSRILAVALSAGVRLMPLALHARQCLPNSLSDLVRSRHENTGRFLRRRLPSGLSADTPASPLRGSAPKGGDPVVAAMGRVASDYSLTAEEADVLLLVASGRGIPSIARQLAVSRSTVGTHSKRIFKKTGVRSRQKRIDEVMRERA